jgi:DNA mismatch repair protein MutS2
VIEGLKARAAEMSEQAARQLSAAPEKLLRALSTGETGAVRADARAAVEGVLKRMKGGAPSASHAPAPQITGPLEPGMRVTVGALGLEGTVIELHGKHAEIDVRGKRLRAALRDLKPVGGGGGPAPATVRVNVDLQPREGSLSELNVIGCTVDEALTRLGKFIDETMVTDQQQIRIIHGHGTGQLRRAIGDFLRDHPQVAHFSLAPQDQGGGGATLVELKD